MKQLPCKLSSLVASRFGFSTQAATTHINKQIDAGILRRTGSTNKTSYCLVPTSRLNKIYTDVENLEEHKIWEEDIKPHFEGLPNNIVFIAEYGFTEMFNNAIDHSESNRVKVLISETAVDRLILVHDFGEGIFKRIRRLKNFDNEEEAIFELAKGKLTTDSEKHTGEGIFLHLVCLLFLLSCQATCRFLTKKRYQKIF